MEIIVSQEERSYLVELLESTLQDLRQEVHRTDSFEFKEMLHEKEKMLVGLIERLRKITSVPSHV
jgi:hypothetical protein